MWWHATTGSTPRSYVHRMPGKGKDTIHRMGYETENVIGFHWNRWKRKPTSRLQNAFNAVAWNDGQFPAISLVNECNNELRISITFHPIFFFSYFTFHHPQPRRCCWMSMRHMMPPANGRKHRTVGRDVDEKAARILFQQNCMMEHLDSFLSQRFPRCLILGTKNADVHVVDLFPSCPPSQDTSRVHA